MLSLQHLADTYQTSKCAHLRYIQAYEAHFSEIRCYIHSVFEMGVADGSSLRMWSNYFPYAHIFGLDTDPECAKHSGGAIRVFIGDQVDTSLLARITTETGPFDIVIDDAGHDCAKQQVALHYLFPFVKPGGWYVIEDLESSYWGYVGRGLHAKGSTVELLKDCMDGISRTYVEAETHLPRHAIEQLPDLAEAHWYPNICFLRKVG